MIKKRWKKSYRDRKRWRERKLVIMRLDIPRHILNKIRVESQSKNKSMNKIIANILREGIKIYKDNGNKFTVDIEEV